MLAGAAAIIRRMRSGADAAGAWTAPSRASTRGGLLTAALVFVAVTIVGGVVGLSAYEGLLAWDVRFAYLPAADAVLGGKSPYPELDDPILEEQKGYVYPPQLVLAVLPLAPLPVDAVAVLVALGMLALLFVTLYMLGVRDARCYAAAALWMPAISGVLLANVSIPIALALAVVWRCRDRVWPPAFALGLSVSTKFLLWPMFVWMLATRRFRAVLAAVLVGAAVTLTAWAAIGFDGLTAYPDLLRRLSDIQSERSYSVVGMAATLGLPEAVGRSLAFAVGVALLALCVVFARGGDDARAFTCAVAATLALSPIVWLHYLVVLLVPMAILRPRFSVLWLMPVLLWISPKPGYAEGVFTFLPAAAAAVLLIAILARPGRPDVVVEAA
jgi:hypothetical protein